MKSIVIVTITLLIKYDQCVGEFTHRDDGLDNLVFRQEIGTCYEIYGQGEEVTSKICQRPTNPGRRFCTHLAIGEKYCFVLKTPTDETIQLLCEDSKEKLFSYKFTKDVNTCFNVSKPDQTNKEVCQRRIGNYSIGITTPDNFTILFYSAYCLTSTTIEEEKQYKNFTDTFSIDSKTERCYKIYQEHQYISPYTCLNKDVFSACIEELPHLKNCKGIVTQNNETVVLHCNDDEDLPNRNCFKILTPDGNSYTACQERIEERCVGIRTPSNLTVLLDCYFCSYPGYFHFPDSVERRREHWFFLTQYLSDEFSGKHSYLRQLEFVAFRSNTSKRNKEIIYGHWVPNTTCYGITTPNNETVILECISADRFKRVKSGCFPVIDPETGEDDHIVCSKIMDGTCVGITTPMNWAVALACYDQDYESPLTLLPPGCCYVKTDISSFEEYRKYRDEIFYNFTQNSYSLEDLIIVEAFVPEQDIFPVSCHSARQQYIPHVLHNHEGCMGITLKNLETIILGCPDKTPKKAGCFDIYGPVYGENNEIIGPETKVGNICVKILNEWCVGITTPGNWTIALRCLTPQRLVCSLARTPYNGPPPEE